MRTLFCIARMKGVESVAGPSEIGRQNYLRISDRSPEPIFASFCSGAIPLASTPPTAIERRPRRRRAPVIRTFAQLLLQGTGQTGLQLGCQQQCTQFAAPGEVEPLEAVRPELPAAFERITTRALPLPVFRAPHLVNGDVGMPGDVRRILGDARLRQLPPTAAKKGRSHAETASLHRGTFLGGQGAFQSKFG